MASVTRRIKRNMHELETGRRGRWSARKSMLRVNQRIARAEARLKERA